MSGSGGGSGRIYVEVGTREDSTPSVCASLSVDTILNSPVPAIVQDLKPGQELEVAKETTKTHFITLVAKDGQGRIAGSLTPPSLITIINCIENGHKYVAVVLSDVNSGVIRVRIRGKT
jgi:hypothetical protein